MSKIIPFIFLHLFLIQCNEQPTIEKTQERPNFLFITCEDISPFLDFYGDSCSSTPNISALASESLVFENAFTTVAVCAPSRSSIITGMYPISIGTHNMRTGRDYGSWGMRDYRNSKSHMVDQAGDSFSHYAVVIPSEIKCFTQYLREEGYFCTNNSKTDYQFAAPLSAWDENNNKAHFNHRSAGQPFFAVFNHVITHESRLWVKADDSLRIDPEKIDLPAYIPDFGQSRIDFARNYSNIEELDEQIGYLIKQLKETGEYQNTYIFFFSDHGGPLPRGKRAIYDSGMKVPFLVRSPNQNKKGYTDRLISFVDIAPTVLSLANISIPDYMQGQAFIGKQETKERDFIFGSSDRFDEAYDRKRSIRNKDFLLVKNYYLNQAHYLDLEYRRQIPMMNQMLSLRDEGRLNEEQMLWFNSKKSEIEFYDVKEDRHQLNNLAHLSEHQSMIDELLRHLDTWQKEVNDLGGIPEAELISRKWPNMVQPKVPQPEYNISNSTIEIQSDVEGAQIVYQVTDSAEEINSLDHWKIYQSPLPLTPNHYLHLRVSRIGYVDSDELVISITSP